MSKQQHSARVERKREQVRQEILEVARNLVRDDGVEAVTLASVAGELSMTKQALYHYFPSKKALVRSLVATLLSDEVHALTAAVEATNSVEDTLGSLIRAFYEHYINHLDAFRVVYCQSQLISGSKSGIDKKTLRNEINPRTRHLFDILEQRMSSSDMSKKQRVCVRQLAFTAWTSALGLLTMLGIAEATNDPLVHADNDLLDMLSNVFNGMTLAA